MTGSVTPPRNVEKASLVVDQTGVIDNDAGGRRVEEIECPGATAK